MMLSLLVTFLTPHLAHALSSAPLYNPGLRLTTSVSCGDDQSWTDTLVDTGSCLLWVGGSSGQEYKPGANSVATNQAFGAGYGLGSVKGYAYWDMITVGNTVVTHQVVGAANWSEFLPPAGPTVNGIFPLGVDGCNGGEVLGNDTTPTFLQTLVAEGTIPSELFSLYVPPYGGTGEISFGWIDESRYTGELVWIPMLQPVSMRYNLNVSRASYGSKVIQPEPYSLYTDSGNLWLGMNFDAYFEIIDTVPGASVYPGDGVLGGSLVFAANVSMADLEPITYTFNNGTASVDIVIAPKNYVIPKDLLLQLNATDDGLIYTWIAPGNLGQKFLENAYTVYDLENQRIGFAALA